MHFKFEPFTGRKGRPEVTHVVRWTGGFVLNPTLARHAVSYETWKRDRSVIDQPGREDRERLCPAWWYQTANYKLKPDFNDDERQCGFGAFSRCRFFEQKAGCWAKWDREYGK